MALSIDRFAPTPAAKLGLALDLAVLAVAVDVPNSGPWWLRAACVFCAMGVWWSTSSVARYYSPYVERSWWEDVLFTVIILLSVVTVVGLGGWMLQLPSVEIGKLILIALPLQILLRLTVFAYVRARTAAPRNLLIVGTGPLGRITG